MLSHESAAEVIGLGMPVGVVHVTVPNPRKVQAIPGIVVHRARRAARHMHPSRVPPQTRVEETVIDLTQTAADLDRAVGWITRARAQRLTTGERLLAAIQARQRVRWRAELTEAFVDVAAGCHSLLERRYLRDVEQAHGLPAGVRQHRRSRAGGRWYDDVCYEPYATLVELDGQAAHPTDQRWRDLRRDNAAMAQGNSVLRYGMGDVTQRPCEVAGQVAVVLVHGGWPDVPTPCGQDCLINEVFCRAGNPGELPR
jgi:very-short-patch-repair endonuclease